MFNEEEEEEEDNRYVACGDDLVILHTDGSMLLYCQRYFTNYTVPTAPESISITIGEDLTCLQAMDLYNNVCACLLGETSHGGLLCAMELLRDDLYRIYLS